jgi:cobaltochelatase CobN
MNTRGESVGQILRYIGVELVRKNPWDVRLKLIPLQELGRPRVDVVVNICGFFRDTFPNIVKLLDDAFNLVALQDETLEENMVKKHCQEIFDQAKKETADQRLAGKLAHARIFGPLPGEYGVSLSQLVKSRAWNSEEDLGHAYLKDMQYAYGADVHGHKAERIFKSLLSRVELTSQIRDNHDYEITDLDHYYEFSGGLAKAVEVVSGKKPQMLITDTTREVIKTEEIEKAIHRGVRTRLLNPKWIQGMLDEGYNGAQHIEERVENILGLAATTGKVDNWLWDGIEDRYILDEETRRKLEDVNPWALGNMMERLLEANKRGYWEASDERLKNLRDIYLEAEGLLEERINNKQEMQR